MRKASALAGGLPALIARSSANLKALDVVTAEPHCSVREIAELAKEQELRKEDIVAYNQYADQILAIRAKLAADLGKIDQQEADEKKRQLAEEVQRLRHVVVDQQPVRPDHLPNLS